jgi:SAM-dependent methyltransferase
MAASQDDAGVFDRDASALTLDFAAPQRSDFAPADSNPVKRSGFHRLASILADADLGDISNKTVAAFATRSHGFEQVFPRLRAARHCTEFHLSEATSNQGAAPGGNIASVYTDGETIPLDDGVVDICWAAETLERVRQPRLLLQEIARVCRDGATVLLSISNRDALYYAAAGEQYGVSPERVAPMSYADLYRTANVFLSDVAIAGYETSLNPALDSLIESADLLRQAQERAALYPPSASGLFAQGYVSKARYKRNFRRWDHTEFTWDNEAFAVARALAPMRLHGPLDGGGLGPGECVKCSVEGRDLALMFWSHAWSGCVRVSLDGRVEVVDLYSSGAGFRRIDFTDLSPKAHALSIERLAVKRASALDSEVIFAKLIAWS